MFKRTRILLELLVVVALFSACSASAKEDITYMGKPVVISEVKSIERPIELKYKGTVVPKNQVKYSFKSSGKLKQLNVEAGYEVKEGDVLAVLDSIDLELQLNKASSALNAAQSDVNKAKEAYEYDKKLNANMEKLFKNNSISKDQLDQVRLKYKVSSGTLDQAKEAYKIASSNYNLQKRLVEDAVIVAKDDGVVISTQYEVGELVPNGYPVLVMRTKGKVIQVGLSQEDIDKVKLDTLVKIYDKDNEIDASIYELNDIPDMETRTYLAKIESHDDSIRIGKIVDVKINVGKEEGVWIPIDSILSKGEQYVYVVEDERAFKKNVTIVDLSSFDAKVQGISEGDKLVTLGMKKLKDGAKVQIVDDKTEVK